MGLEPTCGRKDRSAVVNKPILMKMLPQLPNPFSAVFSTRAQFLILEILINLLQSQKQVRLERVAASVSLPNTLDSRRRKLQRFLDLPSLTIQSI